MIGIIRFVQSYPEFALRNLTETYEEEGCAFFVATVGGKLVGCVGVKKNNDEVSVIERRRRGLTTDALGLSLVRSLLRSHRSLIHYAPHCSLRSRGLLR